MRHIALWYLIFAGGLSAHVQENIWKPVTVYNLVSLAFVKAWSMDHETGRTSTDHTFWKNNLLTFGLSRAAVCWIWEFLMVWHRIISTADLCTPRSRRRCELQWVFSSSQTKSTVLDCLFIYVILIQFIATRAEMWAFESWPTPTGELKERLRAFGDTSADLNESETEGGLQRWLHSLIKFSSLTCY